ncbi:hypothetical protein Acr_06g0010570 [Actinidia rufa]|uniref:Uncharacterized protein n=1 Tax=Actinidia rufa TaxID=165716 RepID=A0A7J0EU64_9ERIC|nr:hypothetical protein Acr_06g0010570 [Actinidia rufa]
MRDKFHNEEVKLEKRSDDAITARGTNAQLLVIEMVTKNANLKEMVDKEDNATPPAHDNTSSSSTLEPVLNPTGNCAFVPKAVITSSACFSNFNSSIWYLSLLFSSDSRRINCSGISFTGTRGEDEDEAVISEVEEGERYEPANRNN